MAEGTVEYRYVGEEGSGEGSPLVRKHHDDAGADLVSAEDVVIPAGERRLVGTGAAVALPVGTVGFITPRSGLAAHHGITVLNAPGTVDAGYRGEIRVCLINHSSQEYAVNAGDRIAQLVIQPVILPVFERVQEFSEEAGASVRGAGGFGSTGA